MKLKDYMFMTCYWVSSVFFALTSVPLIYLPSRRPLMKWIQTYCKLMMFWMRTVAGIKITVRGRENIPNGACIIASKHQSWGDGFVHFSTIDDLAFVIGDHMSNYPILGRLFRKMGSVVVNSQGGASALRKLGPAVENAKRDGRPILIFPEGHLSPAGTKHKYRAGVHYMQEAYQSPVIPAATSLGLGWPTNQKRFYAGDVTVEYLPAIEPGLPRKVFMAQLENTIESKSIQFLEDRRPDLIPPDGNAIVVTQPNVAETV